MLNLSTETYVVWITTLLCLAFGLALIGGVLALRRGQRQRFFLLRRRAVVRGWQLILAGVGLAVLSGMTWSLGKLAIELVVPPTSTPTASQTPTATPRPPTVTPVPTLTLTPSHTPPPTETSSPTDTPSPTLSPTPSLPLALVTRPAGTAVAPPAEAVAANIRFSRRDNCAVEGSLEFFDRLPKTIYAHFFYNNWLPGVLWSGVWYRDGQPIYVETHIWDGSTGGCGFTNYDYEKLWWPEGRYEVQIFIGDKWLVANRFEVVSATPTPSPTPSRTPAATPTP